MSSARNAMLRAIHMRAKALGLDDDTYRDRLERFTGKRSAKDCTDEELRKALDGFHVKQNTNHPHTSKTRAIWIGLYNLGALDVGTDAALDAFARRQTGKDKLAFVDPQEARGVTEALKQIAERYGWEIPSADDGGMAARRALARAQWARLHKFNAVRIGDDAALENWIENKITHVHAGLESVNARNLDHASRVLGRWIRGAQVQSKNAAAHA